MHNRDINHISAILVLLITTISPAISQWTFHGSPQSCRPLELVVEGESLVFSAYPNPASDMISICFDHDGFGGETMFTLFDTQGRVVNQLNSTHQEIIEMPTGDLAPGIYYLHGYRPGYSGWQKMVKQ